jgi:UDP-hydrolysing UDP-N-acetyl-D-glucosamine 2-epimerase
MKTIGVVTVARSDYGIYLPILKKIQAHQNLDLYLLVSGMHLSPEFGKTIETIKNDGFPIGDQIEMLVSSDSPEAISKSMGLGTIGFAQSYARYQPDILLVLGDRFEMHAAAVAALPFNIPIAHVHGGESTEGLIDESIRHSLTKMSHLHFASTQKYANRIIQMGEEPWRVKVSGAPSLDNLHDMTLLPKDILEKELGFQLPKQVLLITFHPVTLEYENTEHQIKNLLQAIETVNIPAIFTYPNSDTSGRQIISHIDQFVQQHPNHHVVANLGTQRYFSLMQHVTAMVGNSSSGIIEAASFKLPVVNIGNRQKGRVHGHNVIQVSGESPAIVEGIHKATSSAFIQSLENLLNPYGNGEASDLIVNTLHKTTLDQNLLMKHFNDQV